MERIRGWWMDEEEWGLLLDNPYKKQNPLGREIEYFSGVWINSVWILCFCVWHICLPILLQPPVWKKGTDAQLRLWLSMHVTQLLAEAFHQYFFKMWHVYIVLLTNSSEFRKIPLGILIRTFKDSPYKLCSIMRRSQRNLKEHQKDQNQNICTVLSVFSYG